MASKLFCDRCGEELKANKSGKRVSFELTVSRDETIADKTTAEIVLNKDLCAACCNAVGEFIRNDK